MNRILVGVAKKAIYKCELSDNGSESWAINQNILLIIISKNCCVCLTRQACWSFLPEQNHINTKRVCFPLKSGENINPAKKKRYVSTSLCLSSQMWDKMAAN